MLFSDAPYVPGIQAAAKLRTEATKLQSRAAVIWKSGGGKAMATLLVAFWQDQKARISQSNGNFHDGVYLGAGNQDIRGLCYKVLAHHRLYPNAQDKLDLEAFCDYFINAAWSLDDARTAVASLEAVPNYGGDGMFTKAGTLSWTLTFKDATGKLIKFSDDHPALGTVDMKYNNEAAASLQGKWRGAKFKVNSNPWVLTRPSISEAAQHPGECSVDFKYEADLIPALEVHCPYIREGAPVVPEGKNGK